MKRILLLAAVVLLSVAPTLVPATSNAQADAAKKSQPIADALANPYIPMKVGTTWEYLAGVKKISVGVAAHEMVGETLCARLETDGGSGKITEHLTVKDNAIYRVRANNQPIKPPLLLLKIPATKGDSWAIDSTFQNFGMKGKMTVGEEKLMIGKTAYDTVTVKSSEMVLDRQNVIMEAWYAKGVGLVRQHYKMPAAEYDVVLELSKFTEGK